MNLVEIAVALQQERKLVILQEIYNILYKGMRIYEIRDSDFRLIKNDLDGFGLKWTKDGRTLKFWS